MELIPANCWKCNYSVVTKPQTTHISHFHQTGTVQVTAINVTRGNLHGISERLQLWLSSTRSEIQFKFSKRPLNKPPFWWSAKACLEIFGGFHFASEAWTWWAIKNDFQIEISMQGQQKVALKWKIMLQVFLSRLCYTNHLKMLQVQQSKTLA